MNISKRGASLLAVLILAAGTSTAQIPEGVNYQGYLTDAAGQPINGPVNVQFALYTVPTGGAPIWFETVALMPSQGLFATELGTGLTPFPGNLFDTPLWMGITVGNDAQMTPRQALTSAPFSKRAGDADSVGGRSANSLADASDVSDLESDVAGISSLVSTQAGDITSNTSAIAGLASQVSGIDGDVASNTGNVASLLSDVSNNTSDINSIEATLPSLQNRVTGTCAAGSSIRVIGSNGAVTCEVDDASLWSLFNNNAYYTAGSVGIGTTSPAAAIQIDAPVGVDPFRARVQSATKLRVHQNGSVSVGTSSAGPENGLYVAGNTGLGTTVPSARLTASDPNWQLSLFNSDVGGGGWWLGSSADAWAAGGRKFVINSTNTSSGAAMVIDSNKEVGIGTTDPVAKLHIVGGSDVTPSSGGYQIYGSISATNIGIDNNEIMARNNGSVTTLSLNAEGGEVRIAAAGDRDADALEVRGRTYFDNGGNSGMRITATNSSPTNALFEPTLFEEGLVGGSLRPFWRMYSREFYALSPIEYRTYSDRSLKSNIAPIGNAVATLQALEGVTYELNKNPLDTNDRHLSEKAEFKRRNQLGFIAQDVAKVLPQLVDTDEFSGLESVGYMGVIPILVEAIKEQQVQIDELKAELAAQRR